MKFQADAVKIEMAKSLVDSLRNAKSEKDQLRAAKAIGKYMGMMNKKLTKDKLEIMQRLGCGVVEVTLILKNLAENAQSDAVRLRALSFIAKCLGMY
jgi:hypothetical protein